MYYSGKLIVKNDEGVYERHEWGSLNKLLCNQTTGDANFTFGEITCASGKVRGPVEGDEAVHWLSGRGIFRAWPPCVPEDEPVTVRLRPGSEYYVRRDIRRTIENDGTEPLFGIFTFCHVDRPCHAHAFSHAAGVGNEVHRHGPDKMDMLVKQDFVEAMYLVEGPGAVTVADPYNRTLSDHQVAEGSAVYHPLNSLHRQFNPAPTGKANFWIHAGYYHGAGRPTVGSFDMPEFAFWHREKIAKAVDSGKTVDS